MKATYLDYSETNSFSSTVLAYLQQDLKLKSFISYFPTLENFGPLISRKRVTANREVLVEVLKEQYAQIQAPAAVTTNIELLKEKTSYTVTTGHQLNIFTGPLYFLYKIVSAINLAGELKEAYPEKAFVPVYWMASEDHDFAEINNTKVHGKKIIWETEAKGATGKIDTQSILRAVKIYQNTLGISENSAKLSKIIEDAYLGHTKLSDATRFLVNTLFGEYGVVIIDADDAKLKSQFTKYIEDDVVKRESFSAINETSSELQQAGFSTQVNAREINFFYMRENFRERITFENGSYFVLNSDLKFTEEEIKQEIRTYPERFSPNVIMRPLYQEIILPNLCYIGGGAEIVYWLQLKKNFDNNAIDFPILLLRNSALIADETFAGKLSRLHISVKDIFKNSEVLQKEYVLTHTQHTLSLSDEWNEFSCLFERLKLRAYKIDPTLGPSTEAVKARLQKALGNLEKKLIRAEKKNFETALTQIETIRNRYFPGESLQERSENFGLFYVKYGDTFIAELVKHFKPLDLKFTILEP